MVHPVTKVDYEQPVSVPLENLYAKHVESFPVDSRIQYKILIFHPNLAVIMRQSEYSVLIKKMTERIQVTNSMPVIKHTHEMILMST